MAVIRYGSNLSPAELAARQRRYAKLLEREQRITSRQIQREARELQRATARQFRATEAARKRELKAFLKLAKRQKIKVKRLGHGLKKQLREYRPEIERFRAVTAPKRRVTKETKQASYDAYALTIEKMNKGHRGVENPGALFLSLPNAQKDRILREAEQLHAEWVANRYKSLGRGYDPLFAYH